MTGSTIRVHCPLAFLKNAFLSTETEKPCGINISEGGIRTEISQWWRRNSTCRIPHQDFFFFLEKHPTPHQRSQIITKKGLIIFLTWGKMEERFSVFVCHDS